MRSGKLRYPCEIVREVKRQTNTGGETLEYESVLHTRAGITTVSGREYIEGGAETMETTVKIVIRKSGERILLGDIVRSNNQEYKILGVLNFDNDRSLQLMCKELL